MRLVCRSKLFLSLVLLLALRCAAAETVDPIERATGLKRLDEVRFVMDLKYATEDNFLKQDVYTPFGLNACYVHPDLHARLMRLHAKLETEGLRLVVFDCYRPLEVQRAMWAILPDSRYVANPARGSLHNRGVAIDCALADDNGEYLAFPTAFDSFEEQAWHSYTCPAGDVAPCRNREKLKNLMTGVGLQPLRTEWWHFQLPNARNYPLLSLKGDRK